MAVVTRWAQAHVDESTLLLLPPIPAIAGEDMEGCMACYIHTDGKAYKSTGAALNASARIAGMNFRDSVKAGQPVTLYPANAVFRYVDGSAVTLTPGALYYNGATAGTIDTAATTGDPNGTFQAVDDVHLRFIRNI